MAGRGYSTAADIRTTIDGRDQNDLWGEFSASLQLLNSNRSAIQNLFTFNTTNPSDFVEQTMSAGEFEEMSEFGVPQSHSMGPSTIQVGYPLGWYDARKGYTWKYLAEVKSDQLTALHNTVLEADNRLLFRAVMRALLSNTDPASRPVNENGVNVVALWDGSADALPPGFAGRTFTSGHQHYLTTGSALMDAVDLEDLVSHVTHHGYGAEFGAQVVVLCNPTEAKTISGFRAGQPSNDGRAAGTDFIPAANAPAYLTTETIIGNLAPSSYEGLKVLGSFGDAFVVSNNFVPQGYVIVVATGGANSQSNPLAFREHLRPELQGLQQIPGNNSAYPLIDSYYQRVFGVGVRHRGAAAVMQVSANATYTSPVIA